jgi:hypothetical protein
MGSSDFVCGEQGRRQDCNDILQKDFGSAVDFVMMMMPLERQRVSSRFV